MDSLSFYCKGIVFIAVLLFGGTLFAQNAEDYALISRLSVSGLSRTSEPGGYEAFSSVNLAIGVRRQIAGHLAAELALGFESRELDYTGPDGHEISLGSFEILPVYLLLQYQFTLKRFQPYLGAGLHHTLFWEGSGQLNSTNFSNSTGPVLQLGCDYYMTKHVFCNLDVRFAAMNTSFDRSAHEKVDLYIDPTTIALGLAFKF